MNGVYQAEAVDFDQDGDLDVAAVSFHPDFQNHPQEAFVIFINDGEKVKYGDIVFLCLMVISLITK